MDNSIMLAVGKTLVAIAVIFIPVIATWATNLLKKHINSSQQLATIEKIAKFAKDAVVLAEKDGVAQSLTGSQKFQKAISYVQEMLNSLGITDVDVSLIKGAVESAFAASKETLDNVYAEKSDTRLSTDTKVSAPQESDKVAVSSETPSLEGSSSEDTHAQQ